MDTRTLLDIINRHDPEIVDRVAKALAKEALPIEENDERMPLFLRRQAE